MLNHVVTSCSAVGWEKYGRKFVETFDQFWPKTVTLHVVSEDDLDKLPGLGTRCARPLVFWPLASSPAWARFRDKNEQRLWVHGQSSSARPPGIGPRWRDNSGYNFRFDAYKFSKKVFAIDLVTSQVDAHKLFWIDADVVTFAPVPETLLPSLLPDAYAVSCLSRIGYHSECGFVGYNLTNQATMHFIKSFAALYETEAVFELAEWHDSWVFDWLRNKSLTATYAIPHKSKGHPFICSELGKYLDHLKGRRKDAGRSGAVEQIVHRSVDYWR